MAKEKKTLKFQMMMAPGEAEILDDWMFKNRVRSRAEAIRRLCQMALLISAQDQKISRTLSRFEDLASALQKAKTESIGDVERPDAIKHLVQTMNIYENYIANSADAFVDLFNVKRALLTAVASEDIDEAIAKMSQIRNEIKSMADPGFMDEFEEHLKESGESK